MLTRHRLRNRAIAALLVGAVVPAGLLLCPAPAPAQVAVSDAPVEAATADLDTVQEPGILTQTTTTATSVTTGGGGGDYVPNASYIASLDQTLFSGINAQNFADNFPGWEALPANSADLAAGIAAVTLQTYGEAIALAQSQEQELEGEDFSAIETTSSNAPAVLEALQANTEAVLADVQEQQYTRQLLATLITVEATKAGEELNERAQMEATNAMSWNLGAAP
jgi:hypothetical protein